MSSRTFSATGLILRRSQVGESDRIINILTQEYGKITCVAKGVRKMKSTKRAFVEPGNIVNAFFVKTQSMPLMTQATLAQDCSLMPMTLDKFRQLTQILEIYDRLFVEDELDHHVYQRAVKIRDHIVESTASAGKVRAHLDILISDLGYQPPKESEYTTISDYMAALSDRPLRSFEYLTVK